MNLWGWIVLTSLVAVFALKRAADLLNLSCLKGDPPEEFKDVLDGETHAKALAYERARLVYSMAAASYDLLLVLGFWFFGGFAAWDVVARSFHGGAIVTGLIYVGGFFYAHDLVTLPFQIYSTFVLEARFGFNRTTVKTFLLDKAKMWLLAALLGGLILAAIFAFFGWAARSAWLWAWGATVSFGLIVEFVAPTWIMPLFNKFTPLPDGDLRTSIFDLAARTSFPLTNVFVMDGSKRSSKSNAFFTGFGRNKRIALFDTLIRQHTVPELTAVMAHEIGHYKKKHILVGTVLSALQQGVMFFLLSLFVKEPALFAAFGVAVPSVHVGLVLFGLLYTPASFVLDLGMTALSRRHEYQADRYATEAMKGAAPMIAALKKLSVTNLSQLTPHPFYVALHYTHPPVPARLAALRNAPPA